MENLLEKNPEVSPIAAYVAASYKKASNQEVPETPQVSSHWREEGAAAGEAGPAGCGRTSDGPGGTGRSLVL